MKSEAIKELERMADDEARRKHPTCPHLKPRTFKTTSANGLTKATVEYIRLKGGFASRINTVGIYDSKLKLFRRSTQKKGLCDIMGSYKGKSLNIEIKYGRDRLSEHQMKVAEDIQRSGGLYFVAKDFESFKEWFDMI
jgi:hypothetical protein